MKIHPKFLVFSLVLFSISAHAETATEEWKQFLQYKNKFYLLSNQKFSKITCKLSSPVWDELFKGMKQDVAADKNMRLVETSSSAKIELTKKKGLNVVLPTIDLKFVSEKNIPELDKVKSAIEEMKKGFNQQAREIGIFIKDSFDVYQMPKEDDLKVKAVSLTANQSIVRYEKNGFDSTYTLEGNLISSRQVTGAVVVLGGETYDEFGGKLLLKDSFSRFTHEGKHSSMKSEVQYQMVGSMKFPSRIKSTASISSTKEDKTINIDVAFTDCKWGK